jgi:hypothetical protein
MSIYTTSIHSSMAATNAPLEIDARREVTGLEERTVHVADGVPARLLGRFERIE